MGVGINTSIPLEVAKQFDDYIAAFKVTENKDKSRQDLIRMAILLFLIIVPAGWYSSDASQWLCQYLSEWAEIGLPTGPIRTMIREYARTVLDDDADAWDHVDAHHQLAITWPPGTREPGVSVAVHQILAELSDRTEVIKSREYQNESAARGLVWQRQHEALAEYVYCDPALANGEPLIYATAAGTQYRVKAAAVTRVAHAREIVAKTAGVAPGEVTLHPVVTGPDGRMRPEGIDMWYSE